MLEYYQIKAIDKVIKEKDIDCRISNEKLKKGIIGINYMNCSEPRKYISLDCVLYKNKYYVCMVDLDRCTFGFSKNSMFWREINCLELRLWLMRKFAYYENRELIRGIRKI